MDAVLALKTMKLVIHVGLARAASTYLQDCVFGALDEVNLPFSDDLGRRLLASIGRDDQLNFDEKKVETEVRRRLSVAPAEKAVSVASWEGFSQSGGNDRLMRVERLNRLFPNSEVLFVIRRQDDLLRSFYAGAANLGLGHFGMRRFPDINTWFETAPKYAPVRLVENCRPISAIRYDVILKQFVATFGKENVHVLLFEQFLEDKQTFAQSLSAVLGVAEDDILKCLGDPAKRQAVASGKVVHKVSFSAHQKSANSLTNNKLTRRLYRAIAPHLRPRLGTEINAEWQERIAEAAGAGNRWIEAEFNLPLSAYGYPGCDREAPDARRGSV